ncbi:MAG: acetyl-CoA acetyltransferase, partial [Frankiales bacterium]|nr:acetyl-CoA acetyltransferase [Frankiales bacterium]
SGLYTKQGFTLWSSAPPARPLALLDVTEQVREAEPEIPVVAVDSGRGTIDGCTVLHEDGRPSRAAAVIDLDDGTRTACGSSDADVIDALLTSECVGRTVVIRGGGLCFEEV